MIKLFCIKDVDYSKTDQVYVIAEAGSNHNRQISMAKKLIETAAKCGANAVKFQLFKADTIAANTKESIAILIAR